MEIWGHTTSGWAFSTSSSSTTECGWRLKGNEVELNEDRQGGTTGKRDGDAAVMLPCRRTG